MPYVSNRGFYNVSCTLLGALWVVWMLRHQRMPPAHRFEQRQLRPRHRPCRHLRVRVCVCVCERERESEYCIEMSLNREKLARTAGA